MSRVLHTINTDAVAKQTCTGCGRCKAACPAGIDIPAVIGAYGYKEKRPEPVGPEDCIECGACTACCPQKIAVKDLMRELAMQQCGHDGRSACASA